MNLLRDSFIKLNKIISVFFASKKINPDNDPDKQYEVDLWLKIHGRAYDFQSDYKSQYYDILASDEEKSRVRNTLLSMLKSDSYSISKKTLLAYVCADIGIKESLNEINYLRMQPVCRDSDKYALSLAYEALSKKVQL
jgi:hypothetical protein